VGVIVMQIKEIMTAGIECTTSDASVREAAERMRDFVIGALPVLDHGRVVGVITDRDITVRAAALGWKPDTTPVRDVMTPEVLFCFADQDVAEAAHLMADKKVRRLVVLDRDGRLVGLLSLGDVAVLAPDGDLAGTVLKNVSQPLGPGPRHDGKKSCHQNGQPALVETALSR
jgi:CBS domain-containing protein